MPRLAAALILAGVAVAPAAAVLALAPSRAPAPPTRPSCQPPFERSAGGACVGAVRMRGLINNNGVLTIAPAETPGAD